jgi:hypothetical protein
VPHPPPELAFNKIGWFEGVSEPASLAIALP